MRKMIWAAALSALTLIGSGAPASAAPEGKPAAGRSVAAEVAPAPASADGVVNINDAASEQLELLPGVGPSRAQAIVAFRKTHPFKRVEDLQRIKGIGKKTFARLRPLITITGPTTLNQRPSSHLAQK